MLAVDDDEAKSRPSDFRLVCERQCQHYRYLDASERERHEEDPRGNGNQSFFTPYAVKKFIENPVNAGKIRYEIRKSTLAEDYVYKPNAQDDYKVYEGLHEAIVDDETFQRAKERRDHESFAFPCKRIIM